MKEIYVKSARKVLQNKKKLEDRLKVKISVRGTNTIIDGSAYQEYFAERVLLAIDFPFLVDDALLLTSEDYMFEILNIKDFTRSHDLERIRARVIGTRGKTLNVLQDLSDCFIVVKDNFVAIIGKSDVFEAGKQAVISIIQGKKQGNVYTYLEKHRGKDIEDK